MLVERRSTLDRTVSKGDEVLSELVVGNASGLFEARHAFSDFNVDVSVVDKVKKMVLVNAFLRDELDWELHVFVAFHGCCIVNIPDIEHHKFGLWSGDGAVE